MEVGPINTDAFFPLKYGNLTQSRKKLLSLSFKGRFPITLYSLLWKSLHEDTLRDQCHVPLLKDLLLGSGNYKVFLVNKCLQSFLRENCNSNSHVTKSPIADLFQPNTQHTHLINASGISAIYLSFSLFFTQLLLHQNALCFIVNCD